MKKIFIIPAYLWAFACLVIIMVTFIKNDVLAQKLSSLSFMKIHPLYTGGELNKKYDQNGLTISVNNPVETRLYKSNKRKVVQVSFYSPDSLPAVIDQTIDFDFDSKPDFSLYVNTKNSETHLKPLNENVKSLWISAKVKDSWVVRVNIYR